MPHENSGMIEHNANVEHVHVRPLCLEDADSVIAMLRRQPMADEHPASVLHRLFEYTWSAGRSDYGFVLVDGDRVVGSLSGVYSERVIEGVIQRFCNIAAWYVEPEYRSRGLNLLAAFMELEDHTITGFTSNRVAGHIQKMLGFEVISHNRLVFGPLGVLRKFLNPSCRILERDDEIREILQGEHRKIFEDHIKYDCKHYVIQEAGRYCYVVTKRRRVKGEWLAPSWIPQPGRLKRRWCPVSDILFVSDPELMLRHKDQLLWRVMRRERTAGMMVEESFLGIDAPGAVKVPHEVLVYRRRVPPRSIDALYTELVILPI